MTEMTDREMAQIEGGNRSEVLRGGAGNDTLLAGLGNDVKLFVGGYGAASYQYANETTY